MRREEKKTSGVRRQHFFPLAQRACCAITTLTAVIIGFFSCFYSTLYRISLEFFSPSFTGTEENSQKSKATIGWVSEYLICLRHPHPLYLISIFVLLCNAEPCVVFSFLNKITQNPSVKIKSGVFFDLDDC
jgi:hypothetical protein